MAIKIGSIFKSWTARVLARFGIEVKITSDDSGWTPVAGGGPRDRAWAEVLADDLDALEAWRKNFFIRQIVRLTSAYVVSDGIVLTSKDEAFADFVSRFWNDRKNDMDEELEPLCDEWTRGGEFFPLLFINRGNGDIYVRVMPKSVVTEVVTAGNDFRTELGYWVTVGEAGERPGPGGEVRPGQRFYKGVDHPALDKFEPVMLHYAINRALGATRGEGDVLPVLPWARRYGEWLKDRLSLNRLRAELAAVVVKVPRRLVKEKQKEFEGGGGPSRGAVYVAGDDETIEMPAANVQGWDAGPDGRAVRLAIATGANAPLHFFAEGDSANRSTAVEMGGPTHRHYKSRQKRFGKMLTRLVEAAYERRVAAGFAEPVTDYGWSIQYPDISVSDNLELSQAAKTIVEALAVMKGEGWITDELAVEWAFKFAGEIVEAGDIEEILGGGEGAGLGPVVTESSWPVDPAVANTNGKVPDAVG